MKEFVKNITEGYRDLQIGPGSFFNVGMADPDHADEAAPHHNDKFKVDPLPTDSEIRSSHVPNGLL